jgi:hypothetical protein
MKPHWVNALQTVLFFKPTSKQGRNRCPLSFLDNSSKPVLGPEANCSRAFEFTSEDDEPRSQQARINLDMITVCSASSEKYKTGDEYYP